MNSDICYWIFLPVLGAGDLDMGTMPSWRTALVSPLILTLFTYNVFIHSRHFSHHNYKSSWNLRSHRVCNRWIVIITYKHEQVIISSQYEHLMINECTTIWLWRGRFKQSVQNSKLFPRTYTLYTYFTKYQLAFIPKE